MGYMNHIDDNGDSQGNFTLLVRKDSPKGFGMYPVGSFLLNQNDTKFPVSFITLIRKKVFVS